MGEGSGKVFDLGKTQKLPMLWVLRAGAVGGCHQLADQLNGVAVMEAGLMEKGCGFEPRYDHFEDSSCIRVMGQMCQGYGLFFAGHFGAKLCRFCGSFCSFLFSRPTHLFNFGGGELVLPTPAASMPEIGCVPTVASRLLRLKGANRENRSDGGPVLGGWRW